MTRLILITALLLLLTAGCESTGVLGGNSFTLHVEGEHNTLTIGGAATQTDGGWLQGNPTAAPADPATSQPNSPPTPAAPSGQPDFESAD